MNSDFIVGKFVLVYGSFLVNFGLMYTMIMFVFRMIEDAEKKQQRIE